MFDALSLEGVHRSKWELRLLADHEDDPPRKLGVLLVPMREFTRWKYGGRKGLWAFPEHLTHWRDLLAGLVDSDGGFGSHCSWNVYQRNNGNIERLDAWLREHGETRLHAWLREHGETRLHVGLDRRTGFARLRDGRTIPLRDTARLGLRGMLRDELAPHLRNPNRIAKWAAYRAVHRPMPERGRRHQPARI